MRFDAAFVDLMENAAALPTTRSRPDSHNRSGQFICYLRRLRIPIVGDK